MKIMIVTRTKTHYVTANSQAHLQSVVDKIGKTEIIIDVLTY